MRTLIHVTLALATLAAPAGAQPAPNAVRPDVRVFLDSFDMASNSYGGRVMVSAQPCPDVSYSVVLPVDHVRNSEDARDKVGDRIAKISDDVARAGANCRQR